MMDIMNKNKIIWVNGIPCIALDGPGCFPILGSRHDGFVVGAPPRPSKITQLMGGPGEFPINEFWEFKVEFLQPDFTSLQHQKDQRFFEDILKELENFFKGD